MISSPPDPVRDPARDPGERRFGVYVHVPYCARACPYCDFDFRVDARPDGRAFIDALGREIATRDDVRKGQEPHTLYVGGGTPSVLQPDDLARLLAWMGETWRTGTSTEWTVEFNPEHVDAARLQALTRSGVDRISLGVQSFDPDGLRQLGRAHDPTQASQAVLAAYDAGLAVSVDLIVGWPGQTLEGLRRELQVVLALPVRHVSIYALTIEPGTPWERLAQRGVRRLPQADDAADALETCASILTDAGFAHYEVASYAKDAARAIHNTGYWTGRDYVGVGPSAASARYREQGVERRTNPRGPGWWGGESATMEQLDEEATARESLWLALRLLDGLEIVPFLSRVGRDTAWLEARVAGARARGNLGLSEGKLSINPGRWLHHDDIAADVL